jgi:hypothetical protein
LHILDRFSKNTQISNFKKICPVGAELSHVDGQTNIQLDMTDRHDKAKSLFAILQPRQKLNFWKEGASSM